MSEKHIDAIRQTIADSYDKPVLVSTFIVSAEITDENGETALLTWFDGGTAWSRLGMMEWVAERERKTIMEDIEDE